MSEDEPRRRLWWFLLAVAVLASIAATAALSGEPTTDTEQTVTRTFADVVRADLVEETEYDGTLGRPAGDALQSPGQGTVTSLASPGDTLRQGNAAFGLDGTDVVLLYGETPHYRVLAPSTDTVSVGALSTGVVTSVVEAGALIEQGDILYEIDGEPVVALYGSAPAYRDLADLATNITGEDVQQLEQSLDELGFVSEGEMTVDDEFTGATASVVEQWQESIGADDDGVVDLGEVVFIDGPTRVTDVHASAGDRFSSGQELLSLAGPEVMVGDDVRQMQQALVDLGYDAEGSLVVDGRFTDATSRAVLAFEEAFGLEADGQLNSSEVLFVRSSVRVADTLVAIGSPVNAGTPLVAVTGEEIVVTVFLPASDQGSIAEGMQVTVELPDQTKVPATVTSVASVASVIGNETVFEVEIALGDPTVASGLDEAPVDVLVVTDSVEDVIAIPVAALLALAEGGYAVELDDGSGGTRLIAVEPGFFADGLVEVDAELVAGDRVVVP